MVFTCCKKTKKNLRSGAKRKWTLEEWAATSGTILSRSGSKKKNLHLSPSGLCWALEPQYQMITVISAPPGWTKMLWCAWCRISPKILTSWHGHGGEFSKDGLSQPRRSSLQNLLSNFRSWEYLDKGFKLWHTQGGWDKEVLWKLCIYFKHECLIFLT